MKVRLWSDIHLEFGAMRFTPQDIDHETVLIIAGDFQVGDRSFDFLRELAPQFRAVLYCPGTHEYYGEIVQKVDRKLMELAEEIPNFHFFNPGHIILDEVLFVGACLWTDLDNGNPIVTNAAGFAMNDYRKIKIDVNANIVPFKPIHSMLINKKHREYIQQTIDENHLLVKKIVVFSHHPPLGKCAEEKFADSRDPLTFAYSNTGLEKTIALCDFWFHGHIHNWSHVEFEGCQIIAKPRGYIGHQHCAYEYDLTSKDAEIIEV